MVFCMTLKDYKIGDIIRDGLERNHMTQVELAKLLRVEKTAVNRWCKNKTTPDAKTIFQIAEILHMSLDQYIPNFEINNDIQTLFDIYTSLPNDKQKNMFMDAIKSIVKFRNGN